MLGAIAGDIIGSAYEFDPTNDYAFEMFVRDSDYTDDTICTIAVADALLKGGDYGERIHSWCRKNISPKGGYGGRFRGWVMSQEPKPYGSFGNGSAMRVSPVGWFYDEEEQVLEEAKRSAECTHNHPEGIKGAQAVALGILRSRKLVKAKGTAPSAAEVKRLMEDLAANFNYDIDIRREKVLNRFDETCQGTVPVGLWILSESTNYEEAIRKAVSLGADADTLGAIVGGIAEALWGIPEEIKTKALSYLTPEMRKLVESFYARYIH